MILKLYRCLKPESSHFYELGNLIDMESEYYHFLRFLNGDEEIFAKEEVGAINCIDTIEKTSYNQVTDEQREWIILK